MYGIPNMKLDKSVVERRVKLMADEGIQFITGVEVGKDYPADRLVSEYDAVVLCGGATKPRDLQLPGRELAGVHFAMKFLKANTKSLLDSNLADGNYISAEGKDVIVIGGGDTGTDCVATSLRHGCRSVTQFEIVPQPAPVRTAENPWPQWPKVFKTDYGQEEAEKVFGHEPRNYCVSTKKIVGDENGHVKEVHTVEVAWEADAENRLHFTEVPGSEKVWHAQLVLLAMGFLGPEDQLLEQLGVDRDQRSDPRRTGGGHAR
jgi:glutamate synthase (NADPH/NADH) small chain